MIPEWAAFDLTTTRKALRCRKIIIAPNMLAPINVLQRVLVIYPKNVEIFPASRTKILFASINRTGDCADPMQGNKIRNQALIAQDRTSTDDLPLRSLSLFVRATLKQFHVEGPLLSS